ncbi:MAG: hypothetical protein ACEQR8_04500 [Cypionkella sp.]
MKRLAAAAATAFLLAACGGKPDPEAERRTAAGEVLGGTISDDMLPLDTVTSQSPPLRETGAGAEGSGDAGESAATVDAAQPTPGPAPAARAAPAAAPTPAPTPAATTEDE